MAPGERFIRFGCPRCTAPLKAPVERAGQRQRCPFCQWAVEVPRQSRPVEVAQYALHDDAAAAGPAEPEISFECPLCRTWMSAPAEQIGQRVACPDCGTPATVPPRPQPRAEKRPPLPEPYALCEDYDPASPPVLGPQYIPVTCSLCKGLMQVEPELAGQQVTCPDCGTQAVVPLPPPESVGKICPETGGRYGACSTAESYEVREEMGQPPPESVANQEHVGFFCKCGTRLHALSAEAGRAMICPDCGQPAVVPPPARRRPRPKPAGESAAPYDLSAAEAGGTRAAASDRPRVWFPGRFSQALDEHGRLPPERPPPRWPMLSGVFTFPWRRAAVGRWSALVVWAVFITYLGLFGGSLDEGYSIIIGVLLLLLAGCLAAGWAGVLGVSLLTILGDTAAGAEDVSEWPNPAAFLDWAGSLLLAINSVALSAAAGIGVERLLAVAGLSGGWALIAVPPALFPLVLLSMLEADSPFVPLCRAVLRSLLVNCWAWLAFYLETSLLLGAAGGLVMGMLPAAGVLWTVPLAAVTGVAALMIYFRLLGRLAWCSSPPRSNGGNLSGLD
jgi:predicted RNA-binding Zn-ribbon protein involved in translation (DUF1610 family)